VADSTSHGPRTLETGPADGKLDFDGILHDELSMAAADRFQAAVAFLSDYPAKDVLNWLLKAAGSAFHRKPPPYSDLVLVAAWIARDELYRSPGEGAPF
jgi:hypothetical protein